MQEHGGTDRISNKIGSVSHKLPCDDPGTHSCAAGCCRFPISLIALHAASEARGYTLLCFKPYHHLACYSSVPVIWDRYFFTQNCNHKQKQQKEERLSIISWTKVNLIVFCISQTWRCYITSLILVRHYFYTLPLNINYIHPPLLLHLSSVSKIAWFYRSPNIHSFQKVPIIHGVCPQLRNRNQFAWRKKRAHLLHLPPWEC